jgi:hypothetical protein
MVSIIPIIFELDILFLGFLHLEVEAIKLFDSTIKDFHITIEQSMKVSSLIDYIHKWRLELRESSFYREFKIKGGITRRKTWELQTNTKEALKHVIYK